MFRIVAKRLVVGIVTLLAASTLIFVTVDLLPGDAVTAYLGRDAAADPSAVAAAPCASTGSTGRSSCATETGSPEQRRSTSGVSVANRQPVTDLIGLRLKRTAIVLLISLAIIFPLALVVGTVSALRRDTALDSGLQVAMLSLASLPSFVVGIALIVLFSFVWHLLPAVALDLSPEALVLPIATLVLGWMPFTARMVRVGVVKALDSEYVQMARLKGLPEQARRALARAAELPRARDPGLRAHRRRDAGRDRDRRVPLRLPGHRGLPDRFGPLARRCRPSRP